MHISKAMLPHSCTAYKVTGKTSDRKPTYDEGTILSNVWLDFSLSEVEGSNGKESGDSMTLYYDTLNSSPSFTFEKGMKIVFENNSFLIDSIKPCYGSAGLEHYEIGLK